MTNNSRELTEAIDDFIAYRKERKKPLTKRGMELLIMKLDKIGKDNEEKIKILNQSIINSWTGVFPLHDDETKNKKSKFNNFDQASTAFNEVKIKKLERLKACVGGENDERRN